MRSLLAVVMLAACFAGLVSGQVAPAGQAVKGQSPAAGAPLEEALAGLTKELRRVRAYDTSPGQRVRVDNVRAEGCKVWFRRTRIRPAPLHYTASDALSDQTTHWMREVWAVNLAAIDPALIRGGKAPDGTAQVWFGGPPASVEVWPVYGERLGQSLPGRGGFFRVKDEAAAREAAAALGRAAELCRGESR